MQFFWEKSGKKTRSRFNLLLLEYGEYFLEDFSVYHYPFVPSWNDKQSIIKSDSCKIQGRLKLCSRSIIFEPIDVNRPLLKIQFKAILSDVSEPRVGVKTSIPGTDIDMNSFFIFSFKSYIEIKANNKIGPYKVVDCSIVTSNSDDFSCGRGCFGLVHADMKSFLSKVDQLLKGFRAIERLDYEAADKITRQLILKASIVTFDSSTLVDFHEQLLLRHPIAVKKIKPLISNPGIIMVTEARVYFQPAQINNIGDSFQYFDLSKVERVYCRRYLLQQTGLEFMLSDGTSTLFVFDNHTVRNSVYELICDQTNVMKSYNSLDQITRMWQRGEKSNFEYLMYLNSEADRSFNDLTQYPVFPHIIKDYESDTLNLDDPNTFRDLSKPIGALNPQRLQYFLDRYTSMPPADDELGLPPPFLYGTHYSTPAYVLYYLLRVAPEHMLCLQNGKFDATDRMFNSMAETWESCLSNPADLKELIPEFFIGNGDFLLNSDDLDLGYRHTGGRLNDVELPPWAKSSKDFIRKSSKALESEYVSAHIHEWIDLIFGYKSFGQEAVNANNLYYYLTYEGAIDLENITDPTKRAAIEIQIQEFGQTPKQLFLGPHPKRTDLTSPINVKPRLNNKSVSHSSKADKVNDPYFNQLPNDESYEIQNLGDEFRAEVERALSVDREHSSSKLIVGQMPVTGKSLATSSPSPTKPSLSSYFSDLALKTASLTDRALGTNILPSVSSSLSSKSSSTASLLASSTESSVARDFQSQSSSIKFDKQPSIKLSSSSPPSVASTQSTDSPMRLIPSLPQSNSSPGILTKILQVPINPRLVILTPCETSFKAHTDTVSGLYIIVEPVFEDNSSTGEDGESINIPRLWKATISTSSKDSTLKILECRSEDLMLILKRSFTGSDPSLTCCALTRDAKTVFTSSWDNHVYSYSISNARLLAKPQAHDDGITSISIDDNDKYFLSGAWDGTVKLWALKSGGLSSIPAAEFYDHENPITSVSLSGDSKYAAASAEDGKVIIWDIKTGAESACYQISLNGRGSNNLRWIPLAESIYNHGNFSNYKLLACSHDGCLLCIDATGRLYAAVKLGIAVLCIDCDGAVVYGGCEDGSLRAWILEDGQFKEVHRYMRGHDCAIFSLKVDKRFRVIVTGGTDGSVRIWTAHN